MACEIHFGNIFPIPFHLKYPEKLPLFAGQCVASVERIIIMDKLKVRKKSLRNISGNVNTFIRNVGQFDANFREGGKKKKNCLLRCTWKGRSFADNEWISMKHFI